MKAAHGSRWRSLQHASWLGATLACVAIVMAWPPAALAGPLSETEPNNDALHANGPFGVDGWTHTINVSDDVDYVLEVLPGIVGRLRELSPYYKHA